MAKPLRWIDGIVLVASLITIFLSLGLVLRSDLFQIGTLLEYQAWDYWVRSSGIVAYLLMAGSMVWGVWLSTGAAKEFSPGALSTAVHASLSWLAIGLTFFHVVLLLPSDAYPHTVVNLIVPFSSTFKTLAGGFGVLGMWLMVLVVLSFTFKRRWKLKRRLWKSLHLTSYLSFGFVTLHVLLAGQDLHFISVQVVIMGGICFVTGFSAWRLITHRRL